MRSISSKNLNYLQALFACVYLLSSSSCMVGGVVSDVDMEESSSSNSSGGPRPIGDGMAVSPPSGMTQAVSIVSFDNVLRNMNRVTGTTPSPATLAIYNQSKTTFPQNGSPSEINAAMWLSITTLAANVCQDLYNQEKAIADRNLRSFFKDFSLGTSNDFTTPISGKAPEIRMIERMGRSFWGREMTLTEAEMVRDSMLLTGTVATPVLVTPRNNLNEANTRVAVISACTMVLASLEAIQN